MTARRVHAVIAAGVESPHLIERWQEFPELLQSEGVDPQSIDLGALRKFAGLSAKVRHNGMRQDFPLSFRLMSVAGLEIELFASYASHCAAMGHTFAPTPQQRACDLIAFLEHWLELTRWDHVLLWDMIRHEQALSRIARLQSSSPAEFASAAPVASSIPLICGEVALHEMQSDPQELAVALRQRAPALDAVPRCIVFQGYWRPPCVSEIRLLRLDEFGYYVLERVDGERSIADLFEQLLGTRRPPLRFLRSLDRFAELGILSFRPGAKGGGR